MKGGMDRWIHRPMNIDKNADIFSQTDAAAGKLQLPTLKVATKGNNDATEPYSSPPTIPPARLEVEPV